MLLRVRRGVLLVERVRERFVLRRVVDGLLCVVALLRVVRIVRRLLSFITLLTVVYLTLIALPFVLCIPVRWQVLSRLDTNERVVRLVRMLVMEWLLLLRLGRGLMRLRQRPRRRRRELRRNRRDWRYGLLGILCRNLWHGRRIERSCAQST